MSSPELLMLKDFITLDENEYYISTLQMQVRHPWQSEDAKISVFETMVFCSNNGVVDYHESLFHRRYRTLNEARSGHTQTLQNLPKIVFTCSQCHYKG